MAARRSLRHAPLADDASIAVCILINRAFPTADVWRVWLEDAAARGVRHRVRIYLAASNVDDADTAAALVRWARDTGSHLLLSEERTYWMDPSIVKLTMRLLDAGLGADASVPDGGHTHAALMSETTIPLDSAAGWLRRLRRGESWVHRYEGGAAGILPAVRAYMKDVMFGMPHATEAALAGVYVCAAQFMVLAREHWRDGVRGLAWAHMPYMMSIAPPSEWEAVGKARVTLGFDEFYLQTILHARVPHDQLRAAHTVYAMFDPRVPRALALDNAWWAMQFDAWWGAFQRYNAPSAHPLALRKFAADPAVVLSKLPWSRTDGGAAGVVAAAAASSRGRGKKSG